MNVGCEWIYLFCTIALEFGTALLLIHISVFYFIFVQVIPSFGFIDIKLSFFLHPLLYRKSYLIINNYLYLFNTICPRLILKSAALLVGDPTQSDRRPHDLRPRIAPVGKSSNGHHVFVNSVLRSIENLKKGFEIMHECMTLIIIIIHGPDIIGYFSSAFRWKNNKIPIDTMSCTYRYK